MTITALPQATIQLLGSAQALTTPTSLVKELLDNALDAKATAIDIIISANTIDKIEVRDNGHGIPQEDLDALGRHGHTSKLRSFEELILIGGLSLGFRGEALASAVQLGELSVTTKTEGESTATIVTLKPLGGIASKTRTSSPVGTIVSVTNFLSRIPVRKEKTLKDAPKTLNKLKDLLQAYCLARPRVKLSLKVLKTPKSSWSYAPRPNDGIKEAVSLVVGRNIANQCFEKSFQFSDCSSTADFIDRNSSTADRDSNKGVVEEHPKFVIEMFLPKRDSDATTIKSGQFISVDSRPVSHEKGTMRKIVTIFRSYLKDSLSVETLRNPFLYLNIRCPAASYDANIEPAKDDVLFSNEELMLRTIESAFEEIYGKRKETPTSRSKLAVSEVDNFDLLKARRPVPQQDSTTPPSLATTSSEILEKNSMDPPLLEPTKRFSVATSAVDVDDQEDYEDVAKQKWDIDMSVDHNEYVGGSNRLSHRTLLPTTSQPSDTVNRDQDYADPLNPFLIAKMVARPRRQQPCLPTKHPSPAEGPASTNVFLPTPNPSSDPPLLSGEHALDRSPTRAAAQDERIPRVSLPALSHHTNQRPYNQQSLLGVDDRLSISAEIETFRPHNDFVTARQMSDIGIGSEERPRSSTPKWSVINKPFVAPKRTNGNGSRCQDGFHQTKLDTRCSREIQDSQKLRDNSELDWAMDFEQRKEDATRQRREEVRVARSAANRQELEEEERLYGQSTQTARASPHKNRYNAAIAALECDLEPAQPTVPAKAPFKTSLPDGDPRAYLMKRQRSMSARPLSRQLSRRKSMKLPLERIPADQNLHSLLLPLAVDPDLLRDRTVRLKQIDMYVQRGRLAPGIVLHGIDKDDITSRVRSVVENWKGWKGTMFDGNDTNDVPTCA